MPPLYLRRLSSALTVARSTGIVASLTACLFLSACGGSSDAVVASEPTSKRICARMSSRASSCEAPRVIRGLPQNDGSCHLNATFQLILNSTSLRETAIRLHPNCDFAAFFAAYDDPNVTAETLVSTRDAVVAYLRAYANTASVDQSGVIHPVAPGDTYLPLTGAANAAHVMSVILGRRTADAGYPIDSPYLEMELRDAEQAKHVGETDFDGMVRVATSAFSDGKRVFGWENLMDGQMMEWVAANAQAHVTGFSYYQDGHFTAYIRQNAQWYHLDDNAAPLPVSDGHVLGLQYAFDLARFSTTGEGRGISTIAFESLVDAQPPRSAYGERHPKMRHARS